MQYPGYNTGKVILSEGNLFPFRILNLIQLQDNAWYYVLQDINGLKHFMPAKYYNNYGFKIGNEILCKIDKVNCTGRIFLEPENPYYKEGEIYYFEVLSYSEKENEKRMFVREKSGNSIEVLIYDNKFIDLIDGNKVRCLVKSIQKGEPELDIYMNSL